MTIQTRSTTSKARAASAAYTQQVGKRRVKKAIEPALVRIAADSMAQPKVHTRQFGHLQRAIDDRRGDNPYQFVLVKGTSLSAFYQLERVICAGPQTRTSLSTVLNEGASQAAFDSKIRQICTELRALGEHTPDVLQIFWDETEEEEKPQNPKDMLAMLLGPRAPHISAASHSVPTQAEQTADSDGEDTDVATNAMKKAWQVRLVKAHAAIALAAPQTKLVVYTPKQSLPDERQARGYEVFDARLLGWSAHEDGFTLRAAHLSQKFALTLPASQLKGALRNTPFLQLEDIFNYAQVLSARQHDTAHIDSLREAARNFHDRGEDGKAYDDIVACSVDTQGSGHGQCGLIVPQGMQEFGDVLKHFSMYQSVFTNASKALVFTGQDRAAKIALIKDLAADTNALLVIPQTSDLLEMIAEDSEEEFEGFLNNVVEHANACGRSAIVYMGELDALLALGEKTEGTLGFNLVATQLSKLCDKAGRAPGWEDLVIILGTQESVEYTCAPLANIAFQAKTCAPTAAQLQAVLRSCLAQSHPSHAITDRELEHIAMLCLKTKSPFHVDDAEQTLQRAARLAFCQRAGAQSPSITAEHVRQALEDTRSKALDPSHFLYS